MKASSSATWKNSKRSLLKSLADWRGKAELYSFELVPGILSYGIVVTYDLKGQCHYPQWEYAETLFYRTDNIGNLFSTNRKPVLVYKGAVNHEKVLDDYEKLYIGGG